MPHLDPECNTDKYKKYCIIPAAMRNGAADPLFGLGVVAVVLVSMAGESEDSSGRNIGGLR